MEGLICDFSNVGMVRSSVDSAYSIGIPDCCGDRGKSCPPSKDNILYASNTTQVQGCTFESTHCKERVRRKIFKPVMIPVLLEMRVSVTVLQTKEEMRNLY